MRRAFWTRDAKTYRDCVPARTKLLLGPKGALVRGFRTAAQTQAIRSVLVSFGATDPSNATCAAIDALETPKNRPELRTEADFAIGARGAKN
jgi:spore coat polysaccharide biosynthesis predicted glycosyltransferase SpsG